MAVKDLDLNDNGMCFGCGQRNPIGLKLDFENQDGEYVAEFTPAAEHQGWMGITHGGILATVADEAMGRLAWVSGYRAVTAEMSMRYKRPAETGMPLIVAGSIVSTEGRAILCKAEIRKPDGTVVAEATATMIEV
ncbi:MAG: PaaI family thioesterase [Armatimonadota bacterium]|nr:PaaI family thioesterase [Armatimonadota bacterium]